MKLEKMTNGVSATTKRWYDDACGTALAMELVGERWSLLIVRELMFGARRFGEIKAALGGFDRVKRIVKLGVFVNSAADFTDQPIVANGASELMVALFGDAGKHARSAVGVAALPRDAAVEVDAIVALA